jgi:hypothetical protein
MRRTTLMPRMLALAALLLALVGACNGVPAPIVDVERGTALPPPGLVEASRR